MKSAPPNMLLRCTIYLTKLSRDNQKRLKPKMSYEIRSYETRSTRIKSKMFETDFFKRSYGPDVSIY